MTSLAISGCTSGQSREEVADAIRQCCGGQESVDRILGPGQEAETFPRALPDVIVCPISSQPKYHCRPGPGDCSLQHWRAVGLRHPSTARVSKTLAVDKQIVKGILGLVSDRDLALVEAGLRQALSLG